MLQLPEESEYQYAMRCIEITLVVILASNKSDIKYDKELVRKFFLAYSRKKIIKFLCDTRY